MKNLFVTAMSLLVLVACGGSGSTPASSPPPPVNQPPPTGGIGRTGVAVGTISNFGSVIVNGVRYDTSSASFIIDDTPATQSDLSVGQLVVVTGTIDDNLTTGTATDVFFDDNVTGPIESIDTAAGSLVVLGQTVLTGPNTSFDDSISPASLDGLSAGDVVEVSGLVDANGNIVATRIELKPGAVQFEVHGLAIGVDTNNRRFMINNLVVDYSSALLDNFPSGDITEGDFVEAKGGVTLGAAGELLATKVELENAGFDGNDDGTHVEIEGFITRFDSAQDFDVSGIPVIADASTVIEGGTAADLGLNVKVEVEGEINSSGVLVAEKIDIRQGRDVRVTALVDSVDAGNNSLVMLGITINVDELTRLEDKSSANREPLNLSDVVAGNYVEVRGDEQAAASGQIRAALLEREDIDTETELRGFVETVGQTTFAILGVTIETGGSTVFRDTDDSVIDAPTFFGRVTQGSLVQAKGTETSATTLTAVEVEFEN